MVNWRMAWDRDDT